ncbi:hypothetical protein [Microbacterium sp. B35-30]|uniref:hypothetical protein n=1 Tax=Microbacterium sp. B35-30 TaxID=1962642 RepID=UPI0013D2C21D|nr:hypothetical protein [Microbacterium sp. B35-30]KAF2416780.1 hypothetical protein B2K11_14650 [Microbacterium sp. B35-30]
MKARFLRPPQGAAEWVADAVRLLGPLSVVAALVWWSPADAGIVALTLLALVVPRFVGVRPAFDVVFCLTVLVAAWSNVLGLYETVPGWDLVVHFVCTGVLAAMAYILLARLAIVPTPLAPTTRPVTPIVLVTSIGLALSAVWEMAEWVGKTFVDPGIFVTYRDSIGDMAAGGLGGLVAGLVVARVRLVEQE